MKKSVLSVISFILALTMIAAAFASCATGNANESSDTKAQESHSTGTADTEEETHTTGTIDTEEETHTTGTIDTEEQETHSTDTVDTEEVSNSAGTTDTTDREEESSNEITDKDPVETGEHIELIQEANRLANGIQAFFTDGSRTHLSIQNQEMTLNYARSILSDQLVESIKNNNGAAYIQKTMDVFVRMANGDSYDTYYASQSNHSAEANIYRFGYYYYQGMFEFQNFIPKELEILNATKIDVKRQFTDGFDITRDRDEGNISYVINPGATDPRVQFETNFEYVTADYNTLVVRAKALGDTDSIQFFIIPVPIAQTGS